jgi:hypothetical protein
MNSISVVVPIHDPQETQKSRVLRMAHSLASQDHDIHEVVITSNHEIGYVNELEHVLANVKKLEMHRNKASNAPQNLNHAISLASRPIVKILFQDDFLMGFDYLSKLLKHFSQTESVWVASRSLNFKEESSTIESDILPQFSEKLRVGRNSIGAPSVIAFRRENQLKFNEKLVYTFDCEWYLQMGHSFGPPSIAQDISVGIALHSDQLTHFARQFLRKEVEITGKLHARGNLFSKGCACRKSNLGSGAGA